jgi:hypothetical protein
MIMMMVLSSGLASDEESKEEIYHSSSVQYLQMHKHEIHGISRRGQREEKG